jgi:hypothetical protein
MHTSTSTTLLQPPPPPLVSKVSFFSSVSTRTASHAAFAGWRHSQERDLRSRAVEIIDEWPWQSLYAPTRHSPSSGLKQCVGNSTGGALLRSDPHGHVCHHISHLHSNALVRRYCMEQIRTRRGNRGWICQTWPYNWAVFAAAFEGADDDLAAACVLTSATKPGFSQAARALDAAAAQA